VKPYYEHAGISIYHCECREILSDLHGDCVITDPPYGLRLGCGNNQIRDGGYGGHLGKSGYSSYDDSYLNFCQLIVPALTLSIELTGRAAIFTGPHIHEQKKPDAIGGIYSPAATGRTPWGSKNFLPVLFYGKPASSGQHRPLVLKSTAVCDKNGHPCPKPIEWMKWLVSLSTTRSDVVIDPFAGSGTTLLAAKSMQVSAIGIEIEERYCEIAAKRLSQEVFSFEESMGNSQEAA
jgi:hypothetical protein